MQKFPFDAESLKEWFLEAQRDLPWRIKQTPYAVWISEVMLQQTQVSVVQAYFLRWMVRFPNIAALAASPLEEVIKMWEGLGYYSRARHLHIAAQFLLRHHNGNLPDSREALSKVKGLGPYTIGAILSFAFHQKAPAIDGNGIRVLTRYFAIKEDVQKSSTKKRIWEIAEAILPEVEPWKVVEGLIELGAMVCKKEPQCQECPLQKGCSAFALGKQKDFPNKTKKKSVTLLFRAVFVVKYLDQVLLKKREKGEVMADLYEFPYIETQEGDFPFSFAAEKIKTLAEVSHSFTRFRVKLYPSIWVSLKKNTLSGYDWIPLEQAKKLPFSSGHKQILNLTELDHAHITY